jgi:hypothetical protein
MREQHPSVLQNILQFMLLHQQQSSTENDSAITFLQLHTFCLLLVGYDKRS